MTSQPLNTEWTTVAEAATAGRVSKMTIYRLIQSGEIPATRFGRSYRIPTEALAAHFAPTTAQMGDDAAVEGGEMRLKRFTARDGEVELVVAPPAEFARNLVAASRHMLGKAPNYMEFAFTASDTGDRFVLTVQRVGLGHPTPHEAREMVEADRDRALALIAEYDAPDAPLDEVWRMRNVRDALNGAPEPLHTSESVLAEQSGKVNTNV